MTVIALIMSALILHDLYADWVTPYLESVEREEGHFAALAEAMGVLDL